MNTTLQARLEAKTQKVWESPVRHLGWTASQLVPEEVKTPGSTHLVRRRRKIIAPEEFDSGIPLPQARKA